MTISIRTAAMALLILSVASTSMAQNTPKASPPATPTPAKTPPAPPKPGDLKKYEDVITKEAKTQTGMFKVHRIDDKVYWEIPSKLIGRLFLWETEISELPAALGYPGTAAGTRAVRFTRRGNKLYLRSADFDTRSAAQGAIETGVEANTIEPIIESFEIQTEGNGNAPVIDVTSLFTTDPQDFSVRSSIGAGGVDSSRSYIDRIKAFPENIETRSQLTFSMGGARNFFGPQYDASSATIIVHYSLDLLPEKPMVGRLKDSRIGFFTTDFVQYGGPDNRSMPVRYINRFKLEKKDPSAALSEPVKPIVFYMAREVPEKWRPYLHKAVEAWRVAFEQAGFKNAIIAKDAPSKTEDPTWDAEDARYCVIRWAPSTTENAMGPSIQDPRSGETLSAHVIVWNDIVKLVEDWYFSQCAGTDPRARHFPMSDEMVGNLLCYVVTHEVGHTLGLEHNFKGSVAYTIDQLRDPAFTETHGVAASIMSYSRYNYVAQPGDGVKQTWGIIGPYDKFAIEYGYKPVPGAIAPQDEKSALDILLSRQVKDPTLRFGNYLYMGIDPTTQSENISNDPVEAARLGFMNLDRIAKQYLLSSTTKYGDDYHVLAEGRSELLNQRFTELYHITNLVGGVVETDYHSGRGGDVFAAVPAAKQRQAVQFLVSKGFETPPSLFEPRIINLLQPSGIVDQATSLQNLVISVLLTESRMHRLQDAEALQGPSAYTIDKLVADITAGAWSELDASSPKIDIYRRTLQRTYLRTLDGRINGGGASRTDLKPVAREELKRLAVRIDKALPKVKDHETARHLAESRLEIEKILENKFSVASNSGYDPFGMFGIKPGAKIDCWTPNASLIEAVEEVAKN